MFENINDIYPDHRSQDIRKSRINVLLLLGLSVLSALVILSLWLIMWTYPYIGSGYMPSLVVFAWITGIIAGQWILVIPATVIVVAVYKKLSDQKQVSILLPFLLNLLAACSFFIYPQIIVFLFAIVQ